VVSNEHDESNSNTKNKNKNKNKILYNSSYHLVEDKTPCNLQLLAAGVGVPPSVTY
jgi:hypothetical protein